MPDLQTSCKTLILFPPSIKVFFNSKASRLRFICIYNYWLQKYWTSKLTFPLALVLHWHFLRNTLLFPLTSQGKEQKSPFSIFSFPNFPSQLHLVVSPSPLRNEQVGATVGFAAVVGLGFLVGLVSGATVSTFQSFILIFWVRENLFFYVSKSKAEKMIKKLKYGD